MREPTIKLIRPDQVDMAARWFLRNRSESGLESEMLSYPATKILQAEDPEGKEPWLFVPVQTVYVMDSIAPNPEASPAQVGMALRKITEIVKWESQRNGQGQVYFIPSGPKIKQFAADHERFEEVGSSFGVMRLKI